MILRGREVGVLSGGSSHAVDAGVQVGDGLQAAGGVQRGGGDRTALQLALLHGDGTRASLVKYLEGVVNWYQGR